MATTEALKGGATKAFQSNAKSRINDMVDSKLTKASTSAKGIPDGAKVESGVRAATRSSQAKAAAVTANASGAVRQAVEGGGNKGGKVDRRA